MSRENVELVRRMWDAFLGNDFQTAMASYDPDVERDGTNLPDRIVGRKGFSDPAEALEAAGLQE